MSFSVYTPKNKELSPIVISVPHSGQMFPEPDRGFYNPDLLKHRFDTDWFVDELYSFSQELGITMIVAQYSRYVVDLNRDPSGAGLYGDGRRETSIVSEHTFNSDPVYANFKPDQSFIQSRINDFYRPYHQKVRSLLGDLQKQFKHVLLWDAHSIARIVPTIQTAPFPDLILGNQDGKTASPILIDVALQQLSNKGFVVNHNHPFKGGFITRSFGQPQSGIHALQLEMSQDIYMNTNTMKLDPEKMKQIVPVLKSTLQALSTKLKDLT